MKRGLASPCVHSAFATTRRSAAPAVARRPLEVLEARGPACRWPRLAGLRLRQLASRSRRPAGRCCASPSTKSTSLASHQLIRSSRQKPAVGADDDRRPGPARADLRDDALDLLDAARRCVDVGGPQLRRQQMPAPEHEQRQIAVAIVVAVEEAAFLVAVQRACRWRRDRAPSRQATSSASQARCRRTCARSRRRRG